MLTTNEVSIESPCDANWSGMTRREATRRFCGACKKHVNDLSRMTESEARALLASPTTDGLCVRYFADAHGQLVFLPDVPVSSLTRAKRAALAAVALAAPLSLAACMGAAPAPPVQPMMGAVAPEMPPAPSASTPQAPATAVPTATPSAAPTAPGTVTSPVKTVP